MLKGGEYMSLIKAYLKDDGGMGTVEIILIIVVLVGLVLIFREQITQIVNNLFDKITQRTDAF